MLAAAAGGGRGCRSPSPRWVAAFPVAPRRRSGGRPRPWDLGPRAASLRVSRSEVRHAAVDDLRLTLTAIRTTHRRYPLWQGGTTYNVSPGLLLLTLPMRLTVTRADKNRMAWSDAMPKPLGIGSRTTNSVIASGRLGTDGHPQFEGSRTSPLGGGLHHSESGCRPTRPPQAAVAPREHHLIHQGFRVRRHAEVSERRSCPTSPARQGRTRHVEVPALQISPLMSLG